MIVPINCPEGESDRLKYTQAVAAANFTLHQNLDCYVYKDIPERPLLVKAELLPHVSVAVMLILLPLVAIIGSCSVCMVMRGNPENEDGEEEDNSFLENEKRNIDFARRPRLVKHRTS